MTNLFNLFTEYSKIQIFTSEYNAHFSKSAPAKKNNNKKKKTKKN